MGREGSIGDMLGFAAWNRLLFPLQPLAIVTAKAVHGGPEEFFGKRGNELSVKHVSMGREPSPCARQCCSKPGTVRSWHIQRTI